MGRRTRFYLAIPLVLLWLAPAWANPSSFPLDTKQAGEWMANYYRTNDVARVPGFLVWLQSSGALAAHPNAEAPIEAFLAAVFSANPSRVSVWMAGANFSGSAKDAVETALWMANRVEIITSELHDHPPYVDKQPSPLLDMPLTNPGTFDQLWATFFATGDVRYPARLIDVLDASRPLTGDAATDMALRGSAKWSLSANMRQHELILQMIRDEAARRTGPVRNELEEMLVTYNSPKNSASPAAPQ